MSTPSKNYILTGAQKGAAVDRAFVKNLRALARARKAEILVLPIEGMSKDEELHPSLLDFRIVPDDLRLSRKLFIRQFDVQAQQMNPLLGKGRLVQVDTSAIVASPKQFMKPCATAINQLPKILMSTGVCTLPNYRENQRGRIGEREHTIGAIYVEVDIRSGLFHYRQFRGLPDGSFIEFGARFSGGKITKKVRAEVLVLGDWHNGCVSDATKTATYELIRKFQPRHLVIHDLFDGQSVNHHEEEMILRRAGKYAKLELRAELQACGEQLRVFRSLLPKDSDIIIVKSNHDEFLTRWLEGMRFAGDVRNVRLGLELSIAMLDKLDPLEEGIIRCYGSRVPGVIFLQRDQDFKICGLQLGDHGDRGSNGARRATVTDLENSLGPSITGHRHTPEIMRRVYVVGTSTELKLDYNSGASSWMNTHAVVWGTDQVQLINLIEGKYKV